MDRCRGYKEKGKRYRLLPNNDEKFFHGDSFMQTMEHHKTALDQRTHETSPDSWVDMDASKYPYFRMEQVLFLRNPII